MLNIIISFHEGLKAAADVGEKPTVLFDLKNCTKQGCVEGLYFVSTLLFSDAEVYFW